MARNSNDFLRWGDIEKAVMDCFKKENYKPHRSFTERLPVLDAIDDVLVALEELPAADVEEVRRGEWEDGALAEECSLCNFLVYWEPSYGKKYAYKYCPSCGAKMDGGTK